MIHFSVQFQISSEDFQENRTEATRLKKTKINESFREISRLNLSETIKTNWIKSEQIFREISRLNLSETILGKPSGRIEMNLLKQSRRIFQRDFKIEFFWKNKIESEQTFWKIKTKQKDNES